MLEPRPWQRLLERLPASGEPTVLRVLPYVGLVALLAAAAAALLGTEPISASHALLPASLVLSALGLGADLLDYKHQKNTSGSIAFIPWTASVLVWTDARAVAGIALAVAIVQVLKRRHWVKAVFNVVQIALAISTAGLVFRICGGRPIGGGARDLSFLDAARISLLPSLGMVAVYSVVNAVTVSGVIAIAQRKSLTGILRANAALITPLNLVAGLIAFYLGWLYVNLGAFGVAGLALPMLAVRQLYKTTMQLTNVTQELLDLMVAAIEARDAYTSGHSRRVAIASQIIAEGIGLSESEVERVGVAALLHDVGKIDEAFAPILAKDGQLTPAEWVVMKRHPIRSAELVGHLSTLQDVVAPVRHHHERWDGSGYPDGLRGAEIPLASRIITFADTLDAMTSDRPYRKALGPDEARSEFIRCRGRQFDPELCDRIVSASVWPELYASFDGDQSQLRARAS